MCAECKSVPKCPGVYDTMPRRCMYTIFQIQMDMKTHISLDCFPFWMFFVTQKPPLDICTNIFVALYKSVEVMMFLSFLESCLHNREACYIWNSQENCIRYANIWMHCLCSIVLFIHFFLIINSMISLIQQNAPPIGSCFLKMMRKMLDWTGKAVLINRLNMWMFSSVFILHLKLEDLLEHLFVFVQKLYVFK